MPDELDARPATDEERPRPKLHLFPVVLAVLLIAMSAWVVMGWFDAMRGSGEL